MTGQTRVTRPSEAGGRSLLERVVELAAISHALGACRAAAGQMLVVMGPAGIGKTSLLGACRSSAGADFNVLSAQADPVMAEAAFGGLRELLAPMIGSDGDPVWEGASALARSVFDRTARTDLDGDRAASVMYGLYWLIADLAQTKPLLLLIDDAHWLDPASSRFISYLARRIDSLPLLLAMSVREGAGRAEPLINVSIEANATVIRPAPLTRAAVEQLICEETGQAAEDVVCDTCHRVTGGNPFYVRELVRAWAAEPSLDEKIRSGRIPTAEGIRASVATRLAELGQECVSLAQATAILGSGAALQSAAELVGLEREAAAHAADQLRSAGIMTTGRPLVFVHPVVAEAVLERIPESGRAAMHAQAAKQLLAAGRAADQAAAHLLSAEPYGERWVVDILRDAAREALAQGAPEAAVAYLRRAVAEPPPSEQRLEILVQLGRAEMLIPGEPEFSSLRHALVLAEGPTQRAELTLELADALASVTDMHGSHRLIHDLLDHPEGVDRALLERAEAALIGAAFGDLTAVGLEERVTRCLERIGRDGLDEPMLLAALALAGAAISLPATRIASLALGALASDELRTERWPAWAGALVALVLSDHSNEATSAAEAGMADAQRRGAAAMFQALSWVRAQVAFRTGDLAGTVAHSERALELTADNHPTARWFRGTYVSTLIELGCHQEACQLVETMPIPDDLPDLSDVIVLTARGLARLASGHPDAGLADLLTADERMCGAGRRLSMHVDWAIAAADALVGLGRRSDAERLAERELEAAQAFGSSRALGIALSLSGAVDPGPHGLRRLSDATELLSGTPARLEHARALVALGSALLTCGRVMDARNTLAGGLDVAAGCGGTALCARARAQLVAAGARPRRDARTGPDSLTPAERRTAGMASDGLSNRQIAQALFVSVKTVEGQLAASYWKLGIHNRRELAGALRASDAIHPGRDAKRSAHHPTQFG